MKSLALPLLVLTALRVPAAPLEGVDLKLLADTSVIQAAQPFTVGLHIHHHEGYHTYWRNPGIVGVPTSIVWTLPEGFHAGPIQWPAPEKVDMAGHPAHGYQRDVLLMVEITPPSNLDDDGITLTAAINWMACANTCHPGQTTLSLPVGKTAPSAEVQALFSKAKEELPPPLRDWTATVLSPPDAPLIKIRLASQTPQTLTEEGSYFFSSDAQVSSDRPQSLTELSPGKYLLSLERSEYGPRGATSLPGVLSLSSPTAPTRFFSINPPVPDQSTDSNP